uniref:Aldehyde oxidase n=1 Tax=Timema tahoe TaxID=61484 RepID=A0A7R9IJE4_9NEOP|nr:unnamed protein product [Timema tahoe]
MQEGNLTTKKLEESFAGNTCRCTGYRPILDAFKSLCVDAPLELKNKCLDIEDLQKINRCCKQCVTCKKKLNSDDDDDLGAISIPGFIPSETTQWFRVKTIEEIFNIFSSIGNIPYQLVAGNTAHGAIRNVVEPEALIDITDVEELRIKSSQQEVTIGPPPLQFTRPRFRTSISPSSAVELNTTSALANYATKAVDSSVHAVRMSAVEFMKIDMNHKLVTQVTLRPLEQTYKFMSYKIMPRAKNVHAIVNAGFLFNLSSDGNGTVVGRPNIVYGGIHPSFMVHTPQKDKVHATATESYLNGKCLFAQETLNGLMESLEQEIQPDHVLPDMTPKYRKELTKSLIYKCLLNLAAGKVKSENKSGGTILQRNVSSGVQTFQTDTSLYPVNQPIPKIEALVQCAGEAEYINDRPLIPGELFGAFVKTTIGNGTILSIDPSDALSVPGVVKFYGAEDIPGKNSVIPYPTVFTLEKEEVMIVLIVSTEGNLNVMILTMDCRNLPLFCSGKVLYWGQPVGIIIAATRELANRAASKVKIEYSNVSKPVIHLSEVIDNKHESWRINSEQEKRTAVSPEESNSGPTTHVAKGTFKLGLQYHLTMETITVQCVPTEDGIQIFASTMWMDLLQRGVSDVLAIPQNSIDVVVRRMGGGYGIKITRPNFSAAACSLAAMDLGKPVRMVMTMEANMEVFGKRAEYPEAVRCTCVLHVWPHSGKGGLARTASQSASPIKRLFLTLSRREASDARHFRFSTRVAGVDESGTIQYLKADLYENVGSSTNDPNGDLALSGIKNCYDESKWSVMAKDVRTNTPSSAYMRGPEEKERWNWKATIQEGDPDIYQREKERWNWKATIQEGDPDIYQREKERCTNEGIASIEYIMEHIANIVKKDPTEVRTNNIPEDSPILVLFDAIKKSGDYDKRRISVNEFNKANRWMKKGMSLIPMQFDMPYFGSFHAIVSIYGGDGTVTVSHGGIEGGQGINTKVAQVCAYILGVPLDLVSIKPSNTLTAANDIATGGSITSESCCYATIQCCKILLERLAPVRAKLKNPTWQNLIMTAYTDGLDLVASYMFSATDDGKPYIVYGVALCEVVIDILTGQYLIVRVDLIEDAGKSLSPEIDIGQVEGAFIMGLGLWTFEDIIFDPVTGQTLTNRTWNYYVPGAEDIPMDFRVELQKNVSNPLGVLRSKATGEPALCMGAVVYFALMNAINDARKEAGASDDWYAMNPPLTVEKIFLNSLTTSQQFLF